MTKRVLFILAALILAAAGAYARGKNAQAAQDQAAAIVQQDSAGADTTASIAALKSFAAQHMGAGTTVTLNGSYSRAQAAAQAAASAQTPNPQVYADAQRVCGGKSDSVTQARCNQDYISKHLSTAPSATPVPQPQLASYQHAIKSPLWTPDLAGSLLLGALAALVIGLISFVRRSR